MDFRKAHGAVPNPHAPGPAITISHLAGSGAHEIAIRLAGLLQAEDLDGPVPWTVFDRNLVEKVLEDHHLPQALAKFIPEDRRNYIQDAMVEMVGVIPPSWETVPLGENPLPRRHQRRPALPPGHQYGPGAHRQGRPVDCPGDDTLLLKGE